MGQQNARPASPEEGAPTAQAVAIRMEGIVKRFGPLVANDHITLELVPGEVHGLLGENGAGKSTLMKILFGLEHADEGRILVNGREAHFKSPRDALAAGIAMAQQELALAGNLSIVENVVLGDASHRVLRLRDEARALRETSERYGLQIDDPYRLVRDLTVGEAQRVEILKAIRRGARVLILDEPTARLTPIEVDVFKMMVASFRADGGTVVLVTHKLDELIELSDRISVFRRGSLVASYEGGDLRARATSGQAELAAAMVGRPVELDAPRRPGRPREVALALQGVTLPASPTGPGLADVSLEVRAGEIVGIAGVAGNGQHDLISLIAGLRQPSGGRLLMVGEDVTGTPPWRRRHLGLGCVPEDRKGMAILPEMSLAENAGLHLLRRKPLRTAGVVSRGRLQRLGHRVVDEFRVHGQRPSARMASLSGGSQQKVLLARELQLEPRVLVIGQPTAGLDVGAIEYVHQLLLDVRDRGTAVLLVSNELSEVLALSDRVAVIAEGRLTPPVPVEDVDIESLGLAMAAARGTVSAAGAASPGGELA